MRDKHLGDQFSVISSGEEIVEIVGLRSELKVWCDRPFNEYPTEFLKALEIVVAPIRTQLKWYQIYTMNRFEPINARTLSSPSTWLRSGRQDVARMLYAKGPDEKKAAGQYVAQFKYHPDKALYADTNTPFIRQVTPYEQLAQNPSSYLKTAKQVCDLLPYLCGHVGYSLEISPYYENQAYPRAYAMAMRYHGLSIASDNATWPLRDIGVESVNWLTLVGNLPLEKLGGVAKLKGSLKRIPNVEIIETRNGVIVKAGNEPRLGDVNRGEKLPEYRAVHQALLPVLEPILSDFAPLTLPDDLEESTDKTDRWLRRFES
jgi:hypothetical protein